MQEKDTVNLLKECNAGVKTAVNSINEVTEKVRSRQIHSLLEQSLRQHEKLGDELHYLLDTHHESGKEPSGMARIMSWLNINLKFIKTPTDNKIAELMYDGCHMGIKSIYRYKNQYPDASSDAKSLAAQIIEAEKSCMLELQKYL